MKIKQHYTITYIVLAIIILLTACTDMGDDITAPPPPSPGLLLVWADVSPIFNSSCIGCHGGSGGLYLDTYANIVQGGNHGAVIITGLADSSLIVQALEGTTTLIPQMPLGGSLPPDSIQVIRQWIDDGALETSP